MLKSFFYIFFYTSEKYSCSKLNAIIIKIEMLLFLINCTKKSMPTIVIIAGIDFYRLYMIKITYPDAPSDITFVSELILIKFVFLIRYFTRISESNIHHSFIQFKNHSCQCLLPRYLRRRVYTNTFRCPIMRF